MTVMGVAAAASLALRGAGPDTTIVWEPVGGPRFPNGAVADEAGPWSWPATGPVRARRWWDPTCPIGGLDPALVRRFVGATDPLPLPGPPERCIGWGPGLTPAGDDVVVGLLVGLRAAGRPDLGEQLAAACAGADTVPFSRALLDHAARGEAAGPVLRVIRALGGRAPLPPAVAALQRFGATSGRHLLDGIRRALHQTAAGQTGVGHTGAGQTGAGQTGVGQTGVGAAGSDTPGDGPAASQRRFDRTARPPLLLSAAGPDGGGPR
ncbi:MAG: DUF2877 domain-containing protein [Acidimicrobiales bacterium]